MPLHLFNDEAGLIKRSYLDENFAFVNTAESIASYLVGFDTSQNASALVQKALNSGSATVDFLNIPLFVEEVVIPNTVKLVRGMNFTKANNTPGNVVLNSSDDCVIMGSIKGTSLTGAVQRGLYCARPTIRNVTYLLRVENLTHGVHIAPNAAATQANKPTGHRGWIFPTNMVGVIGNSEGYGVLLETADACNLVVRGDNIRRHCVYVSAGASDNVIDGYVNGCGNYAAQIFATVSTGQLPCLRNTIVMKGINLRTDVAGQGGLCAIVSSSHYNTVTLFGDGGGLAYEACRVEGTGTGATSDTPLGNSVVDCKLTGQWTGPEVIRLINADSTTVARNTVFAYGTNAVMSSRRSSVNGSQHGGYFFDNIINALAQSIRGIYAEVNTVPTFIGPNDIRNNGSGARVDDTNTAGLRQGFSRRATFSATTASITNGTSGDTTVTLSDNIQLTTARRVNAYITGGSGTTTASIPFVGTFGAPTSAQEVVRFFNGSAGAQTLNIAGTVEGD